MTVALLPNYHQSLSLRNAPEPLESAPNYVRTREATRWHRPRSGDRYPDGRISYHYWCGSNYGDFGADTIPDGDDLCATCEGRFQAQQANRLIFTPIKARPPRVCPASHTYYWVPRGRYAGRFDCLICGEGVTARCSWHDMPRVSRHAPGPRLVDPCKRHGWHQLVWSDESVVCACTRLEVAS